MGLNHGQFTESLLAKLGGNGKYEVIKCDQKDIEMLKPIKGVMLTSNGNKEITHVMWEAYVSVFQCSQHKFETNQEYFEQFKNATSVINQYDRSIIHETDLVNHLGPKEDAQK